MKNTLMFLMVSLLLAFSLTACGGDSQQAGTGSGTAGQTDGVNGDSAMNGSSSAGTNAGGSTDGSVVGGNNGTNGSAADTDSSANRADDGNDDSLVDDAKNALDDVGNAVDRAAGDF